MATCHVSTPLYCGLATNAQEMKANREAVRRGEMDAVVLPDSNSPKEHVVWLLKPTEEANNWRGFFPIALQGWRSKERRVRE